jgi:hypothetical protein
MSHKCVSFRAQRGIRTDVQILASLGMTTAFGLSLGTPSK